MKPKNLKILIIIPLIIFSNCKHSRVITLEELAKITQSNMSKIEQFDVQYPEEYSYKWPNGVSTRSVKEDINFILAKRHEAFLEILTKNKIKLSNRDTILMYTSYSNSRQNEATYYFSHKSDCYLIKVTFNPENVSVIDKKCQPAIDFGHSSPITDLIVNSLNKLVMTELVINKNGEIQYNLRYLEVE